MHLFYSPSDWLATAEDVEGHLLKKLNKQWVIGVNKLHDFNHNDFLWGLRAPDEIYKPIVDIILKDQPPASKTTTPFPAIPAQNGNHSIIVVTCLNFLQTVIWPLTSNQL